MRRVDEYIMQNPPRGVQECGVEPPSKLVGRARDVCGDETLEVFAGVLAVEGYQASSCEGGECCSGRRWRKGGCCGGEGSGFVRSS